MEWLDNATYWHWWVLGVILIVLEVFSPGAFFLWMAVSAGIVGFILLVVPDVSWEIQILTFALFSVASIVAWRLYLVKNPTKSDQPRLNRRGEQYVDRIFTLTEAVVNGQGKIKVDDTTWKISGDDCPAGSRVKIVGVDGVVLKVSLID
ncbi:NfeD family protein [Sedimenticola selenatireducens]|uniref:NfeD family protein n=1 Tax=Sedimenticola selenatireducens TaxID=191960 RepID=A0A557SGY0_9GAMM|nr:NfeD family protein [Sedimenticola selenatireducens]TVO76666.1 NfeD family protein [Sedimenticola selenatireducens]TVT64109.1 MAG: NfeD family protein [Sedimenticola selenatireducens]